MPRRFRSSNPRSLSVIVPARNEGKMLRSTVEQLEATLDGKAEIVVVDDGSTDRSADFAARARGRVRVVPSSGVGVARARNLGAQHASGSLLIFCDAHLTFQRAWCRALVEALEDPRVGAAAPAIADMADPESKGFGMQLAGPGLGVEWLEQRGEKPYAVPLLPGCCIAIRRETFEGCGGFDDGMVCWGSEDSEISLRLWLLGFETWIVPSVEVAHFFRAEQPYPLDWAPIVHNRLRLAFLHFGAARLTRVIEALQGCEGFVPGLAMAVQGDFAIRRSGLLARRVRDDNWFFNRFQQCW